ncbi:DUF1694 domain-containing protein [Streptococcus intermedius]|uniref:DUF1694 domain-containing protein n=1 Tax=Streptococcus intermedius TaxID=1338 RepID=UPI00124D1311|nr:DUF1694 domain-containing protein [Streptococcus intermedius]
MTDINKTLIEKSQGGLTLKPDEQRKFLETFEERVIAECSIDEANSILIHNHFKEILQKISSDYQPVTVKISPAVASQYQIFYLKIAKDLGCKATIVSSNCQNSPFGLVIHSDHPVEIAEKEILIQFSELFQSDLPQQSEKKPSFWKRLFH